MSTITVRKPTYYIRYERKDGTYTTEKKILNSMFRGQITSKWGLTYEVCSESTTFTERTSRTVYTLCRYKPTKREKDYDYIIFVKKDGSLTEPKAVKHLTVKLGKVYKRWGIIPYVAVKECEQNWNSSTFVLERY